MSWRKLPRSARLFLVAFFYVAVLAGHVLIVHMYVTRFSEKVDSRQIAVALRDISPHTVLTAEDIALKRVRYPNVVDGAYTEVDALVGKESASFISRNEQVTPGKVNEAIKGEDEMIVEIPEEWLLSFPQSLRRLDVIRLHAVYQDDGNPADGDFTPVSGPPAGTDELSGLTVAYFKDSSANEVGETSGESSESRRLLANSVGARLEVALTDIQFQRMQSLAGQSYKFIVSYQ